MSTQNAIDILDCEQKKGGFFFNVRHLNFEADRGYKLLSMISEYIPCSDDEFIRFVKVAWMLPSFMLSWEERCIEAGADRRSFIEIRSGLRDLVSNIIQHYEPEEN